MGRTRRGERAGQASIACDHKPPLRTSTFAKAPADGSDTTVDLQPDGMPRVKAVRRAVSRVPTRRPSPRVAIKRRGVEAQPRNDCERMTLSRVDGDPSAGAALTVSAKLCGAHQAADQTSRGQGIGDCAGTIVSVILK